MDEIQDCIADAQFGEVLRGRENTKPSSRLQTPPDDFDPQAFAAARSIDLAYCASQPVGVYVMSRQFPEMKSVYAFLEALHEFRSMENASAEEYNTLLMRAQALPSQYEPDVGRISARVNASVMPSLHATPSVGKLTGTAAGSGGFAASTSGFNLEPGALQENPSLVVERSLILPDPDADADAHAHMDAVLVELPDVPEDDDGTFQDDDDDDGKTVGGDDREQSEKELARKRVSMSRHRTENRNLTVDLFDDLRRKVLADQDAFWRRFAASDGFARLMRVFWYCEQPITLEQFNIFRDLGRGAFGVVSGAKFKATGALLALKCMNKKLVKGKKALRLVRAERQVLAKLGEHPSSFTVFLQYSFTDRDTFYLALPLCSGGDLQYHLAVERYFEPDRVRFHVAEVVLGLAHMHSLGILYRDLKPDNILLDEEGHCRISDMGLATVTNGKPLRGRAGTPGYWAPEMLQKKRYSYPVDWWSLGCVVYELLAGRCPFSKLNTKMERDDATLSWPIAFPTRLGCGMGGESRPFPADAQDFVARLLQRDKLKRLGSSERGADDVKEDPYFAEVNWARLARREVEPPWKPRKEAIHAFNQSDIDNKSNEHDYRKLKLGPEDEIAEFDYVSGLKHQEDVVGVLKLEDEGKLGHLERPDGIGCCALS